MIVKIDNNYKVNITSQSHEGFGVGRIGDLAVFVPGALKDEEVEIVVKQIKSNYCIGEIINITKESKNRNKPICPIFNECGGCEIMHFDYHYQLSFKKQMVIETFKKIGKLNNINVSDVVGMKNPYYYRNKVQVPLASQDERIVCGFYKKRTHEIIPFEECFIQSKISTEIIKVVRDLANKHQISAYNEDNHSGVLKHVMTRNNSQGDFLVVIVTNSQELPFKEIIVSELLKRFKEIKSIIHNINPKKTNVILGEKSKVLYGQDLLVEKILGLKFQINHQSFLQVNYEQTVKMYKKVIDLLKPEKDKIYVDAFCGVGTMGLLIAKSAQHVYGIEIVSDAINNAKDNAKINNINNSTFIIGKVEEELPKLNLKKIDGIIIDPPRKGCEKSLLELIINSNIERIVYVSCNIATLARDLKILNEYFEIKEVVPFDLFPQTSHVETVVLLHTKLSNSYILQ